MNDCVILREIPTACGRRFGHATLNAPQRLNALSLDMIDRLAPQLAAWAEDSEIVGVLLDGSGDKAFCAGGDVAALYRAIKAVPAGQAAPEIATFFEHEYRLDHLIHTYPKPLLCWGQGVVMGGGLGLMAGASHRVVTPSTRMAMPEITIGIYPDVGGSWFLRRMPGRAGLFLALTGAPINAADARFAGLADYLIDEGERARLPELISATHWHAPDEGDSAANHARLSALLDPLSTPASQRHPHLTTAHPFRPHRGAHRQRQPGQHRPPPARPHRRSGHLAGHRWQHLRPRRPQLRPPVMGAVAAHPSHVAG